MFHEVHGYTEAVPPGDQTIAMILFAVASHLTLNVTPAAQSIIPIQDLDYVYSALNEPSQALRKTRGRPWGGVKERR
jgi:hypothetical protein